MHLPDSYEICGLLESIEPIEDNLKLKFKFIKVIEVPITALPVEKLYDVIGERIGIIHMNGKYLMRKY